MNNVSPPSPRETSRSTSERWTYRRAVKKNSPQLDLLKRMIGYSIMMMCCLVLLTATAIRFETLATPIIHAVEDELLCVALNEPNCPRPQSTKMNPFWFVTWVAASCVAEVAALILSCSPQSRENYIRRMPTLGSPRGSQKKTADFNDNTPRAEEEEPDEVRSRTNSVSDEDVQTPVDNYTAGPDDDAPVSTPVDDDGLENPNSGELNIAAYIEMGQQTPQAQTPASNGDTEHGSPSPEEKEKGGNSEKPAEREDSVQL